MRLPEPSPAARALLGKPKKVTNAQRDSLGSGAWLEWSAPRMASAERAAAAVSELPAAITSDPAGAKAVAGKTARSKGGKAARSKRAKPARSSATNSEPTKAVFK